MSAIGRAERRRSWSTAEGEDRADTLLKDWGRRVGDAFLCPTCDGQGYVLGRREPVKCPTCRGECLDPRIIHRC